MRAKTSLGILGLLLVSISGLPAEAQYTDGVLYRQNFESGDANPSTRYLSVIPYTTGGIDGHILQATYIPSSQGSERILQDYRLKPVDSATLSFDVKFHSQFEFARGGKMFGLLGGKGTAGCQPVDRDGWSVRMMWVAGGTPTLYIYHQDRTSECGSYFYPSTKFQFEKGRWYRVEIYVKVNERPGTGDGEAQLYVNGDQLIDVKGLNLNGRRWPRNVRVDRFAFHTFYGGSDSTWSPSKQTYAYFDNFTVQPGLVITGDRGKTCEIDREGIFNVIGGAACCSESCGSCGGSGCDGLPGGAAQCCAGPVTTNGRFCDTNRDKAPCSFMKPEP